jgi:hypothetical protein
MISLFGSIAPGMSHVIVVKLVCLVIDMIARSLTVLLFDVAIVTLLWLALPVFSTSVVCLSPRSPHGDSCAVSKVLFNQ